MGLRGLLTRSSQHEITFTKDIGCRDAQSAAADAAVTEYGALLATSRDRGMIGSLNLHMSRYHKFLLRSY